MGSPLQDAMGGSAKSSTSSSGSSGLFGLHLPKLGLSEIAKIPAGVVTGIGSMVEGLAPGGRPAGELPSAFGKGLAASTLGTFGRIGNALTLGKLTNNDVGASIGGWLGSSPQQQAQLADAARGQYKSGLLPGLINDIGSISIAGQALGHVAQLGDIGKLAEAARAGEAASGAGLTAEEIANRAQQFSEANPLQRFASQLPVVNRLVPGASDLAGGDRLLNEAARAKAAAEGLSAPEEAVQARQGLQEMLHNIGHPYKAVYGNIIRPLGRAASEAQIVGDVAPEAQVATDTGKAASDYSNMAKEAGVLPQEAAPAAAKFAQAARDAGILPSAEAVDNLKTPPRIGSKLGPGAGPKEKQLLARQAVPTPDWAQRLAAQMPSGARNLLAKIEHTIQGREVLGVNRERERFAEAARNQDLRSDAFTHTRQAAQMLLDSGVTKDVTTASRMVFDHIATALDGRDALQRALLSGAPADYAKLILDKTGSADKIPASAFDSNPGLSDLLTQASEEWRTKANDRAAQLEASNRLGNKGLEDRGSEAPKLTKNQQKQLNAITKEHERIAGPMRNAAVKEGQRAAMAIAAHDARIAGLGQKGEALASKIAALRSQVLDLADGTDNIDALRSKTAAQIAAFLPKREGETAAQSLRRGYLAGKAANEIHNLELRQAQLIRNVAMVERAKSALADAIRTESLPRMQELNKASQRLAAKADRLLTNLDASASVRQIPAEWQPLWQSVRAMQKAAVDDPIIAGALSGIPQTFTDLVSWAKANGLDPTHIASLSESDVRRLVYSPVSLGGHNLGAEVEAGTRKLRTNAFARTQTIDALVAAQQQVVWERETNHLIDVIEQGVAKDVPMVDGKPSIPANWVGWDDQRGFLLTGVHDPNRVPTKMVPKTVADSLKRMSGNYRHPIFQNIGKSKMTHAWKSYVMTWVPGHYTNIALNQMILGAAQGVTLHDWIVGLVQLRTGDGEATFSKAAAWLDKHGVGSLPENISPNEIRGVGANSEFGEAVGNYHGYGNPTLHAPRATREAENILQSVGIRTADAKDRVLQVQDRLNRFSATIHRLGRAAVYVAGRRQGLSDEAALMRSYEGLVDYGNMSPFERSVATTVFPFYSFQKGLLKLMSKFPVDHPVAAALAIQLNKLNETLINPNLPPYYQGLLHVPGTNLSASTKPIDPFQDAFGLATPDGIAQAMNPALKALAINAFNGSENGYVTHYRVDQFGNVVPDSSPAANVTSIFTQGPEGTLLSSLGLGTNTSGRGVGSGIAAFGGLRTYTPEQLDKYRQRLAKARMRTSGSMFPTWDTVKGVNRQQLEQQFGVKPSGS